MILRDRARRRPRTRDLTEDERVRLLADPAVEVYRLGEAGVGRAYMARALGVWPSTLTRRYPR